MLRTTGPRGDNEHLARAVIDASGTWTQPNPLGADGLPPLGETECAGLIHHGIPDVFGARREDFADRATLVVGGGHSAFNAVLDLLALKNEYPATRIVWALRRASLDTLFGGGAADALPARGALGQRVREAVERGALEIVAPFHLHRLPRLDARRVRVDGDLGGEPHTLEINRIVAATGFRPDLAPLRELRVELDPWLESARTLGPLIDPNLHSCGTVRPHGARELAHPEPDFYIVGMKSYGRAPTFLLATGYEQARSVVAELAGDHAAAARVELDLPETGACGLANLASSVGDAAAGCCSVAPKRASLEAPRTTENAGACGCGETSATAKTASVSAKSDARVPAHASADSGDRDDRDTAVNADGCCGGAPKDNADACCALDEEKKNAGESGCGCGERKPAPTRKGKAVATCCA